VASFSIELSPSALGEWIELPSKAARVAADRAIEELRGERRPAGSFQLAGELVWRLVRPTVVVLYVPTEHGVFITGVRARRAPGR
jgi:hypothetical protein